jgi:hypothetical protein
VHVLRADLLRASVAVTVVTAVCCRTGTGLSSQVLHSAVQGLIGGRFALCNLRASRPRWKTSFPGDGRAAICEPSRVQSNCGGRARCSAAAKADWRVRLAKGMLVRSVAAARPHWADGAMS